MRKRLFGLDILRASAILLVLIYHACSFFKTRTKFEIGRSIPDGVTLFFVLSGFLIGGIILNAGKNTLLHFWRRRWLRTLPAYFFVLTLLLAVRFIHSNLPPSYPKYYLFIHNIFVAPDFFTESWSLSVEEWFYIFFPLLLFFAGKKNILLAGVAVIVLSTTARFFIETNSYAEWNIYVRKVILLRFDSIAFGVVGAYAYKYGYWKDKQVLLFAGILLLIIPSINHFIAGHNWFEKYWRITFESIGTLFMLPYLSGIKTGKGVMYKLITYISVVSYSIYLVNYSTFNEWISPDIAGVNHILKLILFLAWAFIASYLLHITIEKPFMRMRK